MAHAGGSIASSVNVSSGTIVIANYIQLLTHLEDFQHYQKFENIVVELCVFGRIQNCAIALLMEFIVSI